MTVLLMPPLLLSERRVQVRVPAMKIFVLTAVLVLFCLTTGNTQEISAPPDVATAPSDAACTDSGLCSKVLSAGSAEEHPDAWDKVTVHYSGWTSDGKLFDSSVVRGEPVTFPLNRVIPGWTEGVQLMVVGEKRRLWIPEELAYGGAAGAPKGMLVFDVELISFN